MLEDEAAGAVDAIYDALDRGDSQQALDLAVAALEQAEGEDPVLLLLAALALLDLERPADAAHQLARAVEIDPDDSELEANLALALYRACRFEEASEHARRAVELDRGSPDGHAVRALLLEREGRFADADRAFESAARLDPERFPLAARIDRTSFETEVVKAGELLPERFRELLAEVVVSVEEVPAEAILKEETPALDPELLGLFVGVSLRERSSFGPVGTLPARILLFKRNLERYAEDARDLRHEIAITLYHELGHYLGLDEGELEDLDLA